MAPPTYCPAPLTTSNVVAVPPKSTTMAEAVRIADGRASLEASGGLTLERAAEVAATGVDFISVGALTHSVVVFDLGMDLQEGSA